MQIRLDSTDGSLRYGVKLPRLRERRMGHGTLNGIYEVLGDGGCLSEEVRLDGEDEWRDYATWDESWPAVRELRLHIVADPPADRVFAFSDGGEARFFRRDAGCVVRLLNPRSATTSVTPVHGVLEALEVLLLRGDL